MMEFQLVNGQIQDVEKLPSRARFYEHAKKIGKGEYIPVDYIEIKFVGQRDFISRPVKDEDKAAYPKEWAEYQAGLAGQESGMTPLTALPSYKVAFGLELANMNIHTVEELAATPEVPDYLAPLWKQAKTWVIVSEGEHGAESQAG